MADRKISELTNLTGATVSDDDELVIVDTSATETKAITFGEFKTALDTTTGFVRITGDTMTGSLVLSGDPSVNLGAATKQYVDTELAALVDSAPSTLDTLNELAAALGDDPSFATTVTNSIATKLPLSGGTMTGDITFNSTQLFDGRDVSADGSKLDGIESGADVTDATNVAAAGAAMASNNLSDLSSAATARTNLDVDQAGTALALAIALG